MKTFKNLAEFKADYKATGMHFFDRKTMKFFNSRVESGLLKGRYFITSESNMDNTQRFYNVREIQDDLQIRTKGEFNTMRHKWQAKALVKKLTEYPAMSKDNSGILQHLVTL